MDRRLRQRLESLKAAGIEFIARPTVPDVAPEPKPKPPATTHRNEPGEQAIISEVQTLIHGNRSTSLQLLAEKVAACRLCPELFSTRTQTVFGVGPLNPELCFVGEAPGADEDAKGEPFVGRAGQLLDKIILACGFQRSEVYICNTLKCRPPNNATPTPQQCTNCRPFFEQQIDLVQPKWICCLGAVAARNVLMSELSIGKLRGRVHQYRGIPVVATYHPAYLLRNPAAKVDCWNDMKFLLSQMERPIQKSSK